MSTFSQVEKDIESIANSLITIRTRLTNAKAEFTKAVTNLGALPTTYSDTISTINSADGSNAAWAEKQAALALLTAEFQALRTDANTAVTDLDVLTEF